MTVKFEFYVERGMSFTQEGSISSLKVVKDDVREVSVRVRVRLVSVVCPSLIIQILRMVTYWNAFQ